MAPSTSVQNGAKAAELWIRGVPSNPLLSILRIESPLAVTGTVPSVICQRVSVSLKSNLWIIFSGLGIVYSSSLFKPSQLLILIPAFLLTFWYAIPIFKYKNKRVPLRSYPALKLFSIALVWSIVTVLFPLQHQISETHVWVQFIQRFLLIVVLVLPFDIRDVKIDMPDLNTLPQQIGVSKTKKAGVLLLLLFFILSFFRAPLNEVIILSDLFVFVISLLFLIKAIPEQSKYYASFWVESIPIFWLIFIYGIDLILN